MARETIARAAGWLVATSWVAETLEIWGLFGIDPHSTAVELRGRRRWKASFSDDTAHGGAGARALRGRSSVCSLVERFVARLVQVWSESATATLMQGERGHGNGKRMSFGGSFVIVLIGLQRLRSAEAVHLQKKRFERRGRIDQKSLVQNANLCLTFEADVNHAGGGVEESDGSGLGWWERLYTGKRRRTRIPSESRDKEAVTRSR